jgi:hypothetical protein
MPRSSAGRARLLGETAHSSSEQGMVEQRQSKKPNSLLCKVLLCNGRMELRGHWFREKSNSHLIFSPLLCLTQIWCHLYSVKKRASAVPRVSWTFMAPKGRRVLFCQYILGTQYGYMEAPAICVGVFYIYNLWSLVLRRPPQGNLWVLRVHSVRDYIVDVWFIFSHEAAQLLLKTCCLSAELKFSLYHFNWTHSFFPCFGGTICFGQAYFHIIKGREPLSSSYNYFNTADLKDRLKASTYQLSCGMHVWEFKILFLNLFLFI